MRNSKLQSISQLEKRIAKIEKRNKKVEMDKEWEISLARKIAITVLTYLALATYFHFVLKVNPWINAIVPTVGFVLSTLSLSFFKKLWIKTRK